MASKPKPTPGVNYKNRTPQEQQDYERMRNSTKIGQGEKNIIEQFFDRITKPGKPLKKNQTYVPMAGSPNMAVIAKKKAVAATVAKKKKAKK